MTYLLSFTRWLSDPAFTNGCTHEDNHSNDASSPVTNWLHLLPLASRGRVRSPNWTTFNNYFIFHSSSGLHLERFELSNMARPQRTNISWSNCTLAFESISSPPELRTTRRFRIKQFALCLRGRSCLSGLEQYSLLSNIWLRSECLMIHLGNGSGYCRRVSPFHDDLQHRMEVLVYFALLTIRRHTQFTWAGVCLLFSGNENVQRRTQRCKRKKLLNVTKINFCSNVWTHQS